LVRRLSSRRKRVERGGGTEHAKHHIRDLDQVIATFTDERPWSYVVDSESHAPSNVYKNKCHELPPAASACIIFDAVNNLRATLDQIGYSAAIASGKINPKSVSIPLRILGPLYQSAATRCDATGDYDDQQALFWVAKANGCAAIPSGVVCHAELGSSGAAITKSR
jgi:hypothetical protein